MKAYLFLLLLSISVFSQDCVENTIKKLESIHYNRTLEINFKPLFKSSKYTLSPTNYFGIHNHFQGVFLDDKKLFVTGGNKNNKSADLFVFNLKTKNLKTIKLNNTKKHWHAGAFQKFKNKLIIPIERLSYPLSSQIMSFDLESQNVISLYNKSSNKTGAIDFLNLDENQYIVFFDPLEISIYKFPSFELVQAKNISFFTGSSAKIIKDCNGKIYFLNLTNNGLFPPIFNNENIINLYEFSFENFSLNKVKDLVYQCKNCNFRGAVNLQNNNGKFSIVSSDMYLNMFNHFLYVDILEEIAD